MENGNKKNIDKLLKITLSNQEKASLILNNNIKREIRKRDVKKKELSVWWLPLICAICISIIISIGSYLFIDTLIIKAGIMLITVLTSISVIIITIIGLKYFELREGAVLR